MPRDVTIDISGGERVYVRQESEDLGVSIGRETRVRGREFRLVEETLIPPEALKGVAEALSELAR